VTHTTSAHLVHCVAAVFLCSTVFLSGCKPQNSAATPGSSTTQDGSSSKSVSNVIPSRFAPAPILDGWKKPALALLLSGEQHGYLEPCGCSETQSGGMARRADLVQQIVEGKGWDVVGLDVGGTLRRSRRQDGIKFDKMFEAFQQMNYKAVGVGVEELKMGPEFILTHQIADPDELAKSAALVSANVQLFGQDFGWPLPYRVIEKAGVTIGVTSIIAPSLRDKVAPAGVNNNIEILDPNAVLPGVINALQEHQPKFLVLLCHGKDSDAIEMAKAYPQFRVILAAGGYDEPDGKPIKVGDTWVLHTGHKGKRVGVLGYYPDSADEPFKFELIQLDKERFKNHPAMRELMRNYQQQLEDEGIAASDELLLNKHLSGNTFVGAEKCAGCHTKAFAQWKETGHAAAFTTLKEGPWNPDRADEKIGWIKRQFDPECLSCHVTGWHPQEMLRYGSGYVKEQESAHLLGQQCENCHGPGSLHVEREESGTNDMAFLEEGRRTVRRTLEEAKRSMCVECHDPDNSPKFTPERFDEFWEKVKHPFKD
jgi:hypothetical protein